MLTKHQEEVRYTRKVILLKALPGILMYAWSMVSLRTGQRSSQGLGLALAPLPCGILFTLQQLGVP